MHYNDDREFCWPSISPKCDIAFGKTKVGSYRWPFVNALNDSQVTADSTLSLEIGITKWTKKAISTRTFKNTNLYLNKPQLKPPKFPNGPTLNQSSK